MSETFFDLTVALGRWQPPHRSHIENVLHAAGRSKRTIVFSGSANRCGTAKNPWSATERAIMIARSLPGDLGERMHYFPVNDFDHTPTWAKYVSDTVHAFADTHGLDHKRIALVGHRKDASSFYLDEFPQWHLIECDDTSGLSATQFREPFFNLASDEVDDWLDSVRQDLPDGVRDFLRGYHGSPEFHAITNTINA